MLRDRRLGSAMLLIPLGLSILVSIAFAGATPVVDPHVGAESSSSLRLNEVLPWPIVGNPEWVELINTASEPLGLTGWRVEGTRGTTPITFALGDGFIAPGELVVVLTPAILNNLPPGSLRLLAPDGAVVDSFSYESVAVGKAWGRQPDGTGEWSPGLDPSPGAANSPMTATPTSVLSSPTDQPTVTSTDVSATPSATPTETPTETPPTASATVMSEPSHTSTAASATSTASPTVDVPTRSPTATSTTAQSWGIVLNEVMPVPGGEWPSPWIELYNNAGSTQQVRGWSFGNGRNQKLVVEIDIAIAPGAWLLMTLPIGLLDPDDTLTIYAADGQTVDHLTYQASQLGSTWARIPNGQGTWRATRRASAGALNEWDDATPTATTGVAPSPVPTVGDGPTATRARAISDADRSTNRYGNAEAHGYVDPHAIANSDGYVDPDANRHKTADSYAKGASGATTAHAAYPQRDTHRDSRETIRSRAGHRCSLAWRAAYAYIRAGSTSRPSSESDSYFGGTGNGCAECSTRATQHRANQE